jgi:ubiquinol-cytochrome c reductase iron-sulfur subunit
MSEPTKIGKIPRGRIDPKSDPRFQIAAKNPRRIEALIGLSFFGSFLAFIALGAAYWVGAPNEVLGVTLALGFAGLAVGFIMAGKYLMPKGPFAEDRHPLASSENERRAFGDSFIGRGEIVAHRRGFLGLLLGLASSAFGIVALFPLLRSLGPNPGSLLFHTEWRKGSYVVDSTGRKITVNDLDVGSFMTVFPNGHVGSFVSQTLLIRVADASFTTRPGRESWGPAGYLAYSKVCTHAGCPISLYQQDTEQLLCPCHQSLFNILAGAEPVFGPAPRPLPQLPLYIDKNGYIRAQSDYSEPIGPGFWDF